MRKIKKKLPPLSGFDIFLYLVLLMGCVVVFFLEELLIIAFSDRIAFRDPNVTAYHSLCHIGLIALAAFCLAAFTKLCLAIYAKQPIFGSKKIRYGHAPWHFDLYPLFWPRRDLRPKTPEKSRKSRARILAWVLSFVLCLCLMPLDLCPRNCFTTDSTIVRYDVLDCPGDTVYTHHDFSHLTISGKSDGGFRGPRRYFFSMILEMEDGETVSFDCFDFRGSELRPVENGIRAMQAMKSQFSREDISIEGVKYLPDIVRDRGLNAREARLLYELFEVNPNG